MNQKVETVLEISAAVVIVAIFAILPGVFLMAGKFAMDQLDDFLNPQRDEW